MFRYALMAILIVAMAAGVAQADPALTYKFDAFATDVPRFIGDGRIGTIRSGGFRLYADDPSRHTLLLGIEYEGLHNDFDRATTLVVPEHSFNLGANLPLPRPLFTGVRLAASSLQYRNDEPFSTFGVYPYRRFHAGSAELGFEQDQQHRTWVFGLGTFTVPTGELVVGGSFERLPLERGSADTHQVGRAGLGTLVAIPDTRLDLFGAGNYSPDDERFVWMGGLSFNADLHQQGIQPAGLLAHRRKPGTHYTLGIVTLLGRTLNSRVTRTIHEAFFRGGLKETRIIGGRYMGDPGLGKEHELVDFGGVAVAASNLEVAAGSATLLEREVSAYGTLSWSRGPVANPSLGLTYGESSDLVFNPRTHTLDDPVRRYWEVKLALKLPLGAVDPQDHRRQGGYARLWLAADNRGGVRFKATSWF